MSSIKAVFTLSVTIAIASVVGATTMTKPLDVGILESLLRGDMQSHNDLELEKEGAADV